MLDLSQSLRLVFVALVIFNLLAATQDIATDGLAVHLLQGRDRGLANGIQVGGYRLGMVLGGGLLLWIYSLTGWRPMRSVEPCVGKECVRTVRSRWPRVH